MFHLLMRLYFKWIKFPQIKITSRFFCGRFIFSGAFSKYLNHYLTRFFVCLRGRIDKRSSIMFSESVYVMKKKKRTPELTDCFLPHSKCPKITRTASKNIRVRIRLFNPYFLLCFCSNQCRTLASDP